MKTIKKLMSIFVLAVILVMAGCQNEGIIEESSAIPVLNDFEKSIMDKAGPELGTQILERMNNPLTNAMKTPIVYEGELCPDVVNPGTVDVKGGVGNLAVAKFWSFSGTAGDVVTIEVDRVTCEMDPVMNLYFGSGDTTSLVFVTGADDNDPAACVTCFAYDDPTISGYVLPSTGDYTVAVWDFISCGAAPFDYTIVASGQNPCTIVIDGCDTGVANQTLEDGSTMQDVIDACAAAALNHGGFVSCVAHATNAWKKAGLISGKEKGAIQSCAAESDIPS